MKTKAILATLLVAAVASADARFAWPYPPKAVSPDEIGHRVVINGNAWPDSAESKLTTASLSGEPDGLKASPTKKVKAELKTGVFHSAWPASGPCSPDSNVLRRSRSSDQKTMTMCLSGTPAKNSRNCYMTSTRKPSIFDVHTFAWGTVKGVFVSTAKNPLQTLNKNE